MTTEFVTLANHTDYEILNDFPHTIRKKSNEHIVSEFVDDKGYYALNLMDNGKYHIYRKHRLIAVQFIDNPDNLPCVDHINRNRLDNRIDNLRWVTRSDNNRNKVSHINITYEYVDDIPDESLVIDEYGKHTFENYYYNNDTDSFYYFNGQQYRVLHINTDKHGNKFVCMLDINNIKVLVYLAKFKKLYNIL